MAEFEGRPVLLCEKEVKNLQFGTGQSKLQLVSVVAKEIQVYLHKHKSWGKKVVLR